MIGGVTVNVITGIIIFIALTFFYGEKFLPAKEAKYGIVAYPLAQEIGLKTGDKILKVNGEELVKFAEVLSPDVILGTNSYYTIDRDGQILDIKIPSNFADKISEKKNQGSFIEPAFPFKIGKVIDNTPASKAGIKEGDMIVGIDADSIKYFHQLQSSLKTKKSKPVLLSINRDGKIISLKANVSEEGKLGFQAVSLLKDSTESFGVLKSIEKGTVKAFTIVVVQVKAFKKMFAGEIDVTKSLSGPIGIAKEFGGTWDWVRFWSLTGLLSMVLAFMNLLPIPALDGGHIMFLLYEIISGRKPSDKVLEVAQRIGTVILMALTFFAIFNDVFKLFF